VSNLFSRARTWIGAKVQAAAGVSVLYVRGETTLPLTVIVGRTAFSSNVADGPRVSWGERDYLVEAADLTVGIPALGDRITEVIDGTTTVFEIVTPDTGEPAWRWSDQGRTRWRLHVKKVG
jgi:hypothetical protein